MTRYRLDYEPKARKQLRAIKDVRLRGALVAALAGLMDDPRPPGCLKMAGYRDQWRIRVGDWRVIYRIDDGILVVLVVTLGPRGGVYRGA